MSAKKGSSEMSAFRAYILNSTQDAKEKADSAAKKVMEGTNDTVTTAKKTTKEVEKAVKDTAATKATETKAAAKKTTAATKTAAKKTAETTKASAKKTTTTAKKAVAKKTAPKTSVELQFAGKSVSYDALVDNAKAAFVNAGHKESEIKTVNLYVKPEESMVYYVINDEQGSFAI